MNKHRIDSTSLSSREGDQKGPQNVLRTGLSGISSVLRTVQHYGLVFVFVATALALSLLLQPFVPHGFVYLFLASVVASAWLGNRGPGLFAVVLASLTLDYFFLLPLHTLGIGWVAWPYFLPFLLSSLAASWMSSTRKREKSKSLLQSAAFNAAASAIVITDPRGTIQWVNPAFTKLTGYTFEETVGQNPRILKSNRQDRHFSKNLWDTILAGEIWSGEITNLKKDGQSYIEEMTIAPVRSGHGEVTNFVAIKQDLTDRRRSEEAMRRSEMKFRTLFDSTTDAVMLLDEKGFSDCNKAALLVYGCSSKEALCSRHPADLSPPTQPGGMDSLTLANQHIATAVQKGSNHFEWVHKRADTGEIFSADVQLTAMDLDGERTVQAVVRDITERKQAEQTLHASEEQFRQLADNIHEVFFVVEPDPVQMKYLSPAYDDVWGRPRQETYDRPAAWIESVHPEDREGVGHFFARSIQGIQSEMAYRIVRPDNSIRWISARTFPVRDAEGRLKRIVGIAEDTTERRHTHEKLEVALEELKEQTQDTAKLAELVDILQSCQSADEAFKIIGSTLQNMLPTTAGALYITSPSRNIVEMVVNWGDIPDSDKAFSPEDCWALRRGKAHRVKDSDSPLRCAHASKSLANGYVCLPLAAQGETLGVLYVENRSDPACSTAGSGPDPVEVLERQATAIGERISLALANLRLREVLRGQSIRDPLTGLFNRRFMEESLERELRRAERSQLPVALLMVDIDHFKRFNDTFGHQAGDALLRALGNLLKETTRGQDVVCRYGGEEFAFVLSGASLEAAQKRAELLQGEIKQLNVRHGGQLLGTVTISVGIAIFPNNGDGAEQLLKAADDALYRAKEEGRDRIIVACQVA